MTMNIPNYYQEWNPKPEHFEAVEKYNKDRFNRCQEQLKKPVKKKK